MRIALLSALEPLDGGVLSPRGLTRIGGRTVLQSQLDFALAAGCERIVCLSQGLPSELITLQHDAERANAKFQCVRDAKPLSGLVKAVDAVLVIADGVVFDMASAPKFESNERWIGAFPANEGIAAGFERIDRDRSWSGIMLVPGSLVEKLSEFPSDIDVQSSLLRLALQNGVKTRAVDEQQIAQGRWAIIDSEGAASNYSDSWLGQVIRKSSPLAPTHGLADLAALAVLRRHADPLRAARLVNGVSTVSLCGAFLAAYLAQPAIGFVSILLSVFACRFSETTSLVAGGCKPISKVMRHWSALQSLMTDAALAAVTLVSVQGSDRMTGLFAIFMLLLVIRIVEASIEEKPWLWLSQLMTDRGTIAIVCMIALSAGLILPSIQVVAVLYLGVELLRTYRAKLT